jgi:hypothetical protein
MRTYAYLNAVLDSNPNVTRLVLDAVPFPGGAPSIYAVAMGSVPDGEQSIPGRVSVEPMPSDAAPFYCAGYDAAGALICQFFA